MTRKYIEWSTFVVCFAIGVGGAIGQAKLLHNSLVHSYPFKMMEMPPASFYAWIGEYGFYLSFALAVVSTLLSKMLRPRFIVLIPVVVCPLAYWLFFETSFLFSSFTDEMMRERNFDGYTGLTARYEFGFEVGSLIFWGSVIGLIIGYLVDKISSILDSRLASHSADNTHL